jgi:cyclopropane-fatty-acyl-phospholipid synthase
MDRFVEGLRQAAIAVETNKPEEQHYELPPEFFQKVLRDRMKYSACYWPPGVNSLHAAEEALLSLTCDRAQLEDGIERAHYRWQS